MSSFTIRTAQPEDAPALARLLQSIGWFASFETGCPEDHAAAIAPLLKPCERQLQLLAVDAQGQVLGYCATHWLPTAILQRMDAYVSELFVHASARGMGGGRQTAGSGRGCCTREGLQPHLAGEQSRPRFLPPGFLCPAGLAGAAASGALCAAPVTCTYCL